MTGKNRYDGLLQKLISGDITPEERFWIEKKALDDPLLFEAIEGFAAASVSDHFEHIESLKKRIISVRRKRKIRRLALPISIAASIAVLFFAGKFVFHNDSGASEGNIMVMNEEEPQDIQNDQEADIVTPEYTDIPGEVIGESKEKVTDPVKPPPIAALESPIPVDRQSGQAIASSDLPQNNPSQEIISDREEKIPEATLPIPEEKLNLDDAKKSTDISRQEGPLSARRGLPLKNMQTENVNPLSISLPVSDIGLNTYLSEKYLLNHDVLAQTINITFGVTLDNDLMPRNIRIISGDSIVGNRLIPFLKEYRNWKSANNQRSKELKYLFVPVSK